MIKALILQRPGLNPLGNCIHRLLGLGAQGFGGLEGVAGVGVQVDGFRIKNPIM